MPSIRTRQHSGDGPFQDGHFLFFSTRSVVEIGIPASWSLPPEVLSLPFSTKFHGLFTGRFIVKLDRLSLIAIGGPEVSRGRLCLFGVNRPACPSLKWTAFERQRRKTRVISHTFFLR